MTKEQLITYLNDNYNWETLSNDKIVIGVNLAQDINNSLITTTSEIDSQFA